MEHEHEARPISSIVDLFGISRAVSKKGVPRSERSELLTYFLEHATDRKGPLAPARMGMLLSHLKLPDLYYMKSTLEQECARPDGPDFPKRNYSTKWNQIFWGMLKPRPETR